MRSCKANKNRLVHLALLVGFWRCPEMLLCRNLLRSNGGLELAPEICLCVFEHLISIKGTEVASLRSTCKAFSRLLQQYEKSLCQSISESTDQFKYTNELQDEIAVSCLAPTAAMITRMTYRWICELQLRNATIEALVHHDLTSMREPDDDWPKLDRPAPELEQRRAFFKRRGFLLLYKLVDCHAGVSSASASSVRVLQAEFLDALTTEELAVLGVIVEVMGHNFSTLTTNALELLDNCHSPMRPGVGFLWHPQTPSDFSQPVDEHRIRECMCVFEDLVQRYGPYFAWAHYEGTQDTLNRPDLHSNQLMRAGLENMDAYELGYTMSYASLQSVVWKIFCKKMGCAMPDSWKNAKELIEKEMSEYHVAVLG